MTVRPPSIRLHGSRPSFPLRSRLYAVLAVGLLLAVVLPTQGLAQNPLRSFTYPRLNNSEVTIQSYFGTSSTAGAVPYLVTFKNSTAQSRTWHVTFNDSEYGPLRGASQLTFQIPAHSTESHLVHHHHVPSLSRSSYHSRSIRLSTPGEEVQTHHEGNDFNQAFPVIALSKALGESTINQLDDEARARSGGNGKFGELFEPGTLPENWLSYTCLDYLLIDLPSWQRLKDEQKAAVMTWVRLGGNLHVFTQDPQTGYEALGIAHLSAPPMPTTDDPARTSMRASLGTVGLRTLSGDTLDMTWVDHYTKSTPEPLGAQILNQYRDGTWHLRDLLPLRTSSSWLVIFLLGAFAIVVGPINLFLLAGPGRRHRLFITTPLISLIACFCLVSYILLRDGVGGVGSRIAVVDLQTGSGSHEALILQEQLSQTGVMLSTGFHSTAPINILPVLLERSSRSASSQAPRTRYGFNVPQYSGHFFRSRSDQGFFIRSVLPTRARIELKSRSVNGQPPQLVSNLGSVVNEFYYIDEDENVWKHHSKTPTAPGGTFVLEPSDRPSMERWLEGKTYHFSEQRNIATRALAQDKTRFFAILAKPEEFLITTHPSIEWKQDQLLLTGMIGGAAAPAASSPPTPTPHE